MRNRLTASLLITLALIAGCTAGQSATIESGTQPIRHVEIVDGAMRVNGQVFLPIIAWGQPFTNYEKLSNLGFNVFAAAGSWAPPAEKLADEAGKVGAYAAAEFRDGDEATVKHPYLLAWFQDDEPDMPQRSRRMATPDDLEERRDTVAGYEPKVPVEHVLEYYRRVKSADPMRPVWLTFTGHFTSHFRTRYSAEQQAQLYPAYTRGADMVGFDIYPIYGHGRPAWLNMPAEGVEELRKLAGPERPVYAWIETSKGSRWMSYELQPDVLPVHTRFQVWGSLIRGAVGIGYFTHAWKPEFVEFAPTEDMQRELAAVNGQMTRLAPAILAPRTARAVSITMSDGLTSHFKATEHAGHLYIFSQITDLGPDADKLGQFDPINPRGGRATIIVPGLTAGSTVEVVDENRTITAQDGRFEDDFKPLGEHVYRIRLRR